MLKGKTAIVTGATKGIGKAIAQLFADQGAVVYGLGRNQEDLNKLNEYADNMHAVLADVCNGNQCKEIFSTIYKEEGRIDILVNNAGIMQDALIGMITDSQIQMLFQTNVYAVIQLTQLAARFMKRRKEGIILNLSSIIGTNGNPGQSVYSATKGAVISFTKSAAKELAPQGIRVNAIAPGIIQTDLLASVPEEKLQERISKIQLGRMGTPQEVAEAALFLASDRSRYISGQILGVDGVTIL